MSSKALRVVAEDGIRPIESIAEGQLVWAYDLVASIWRLRRVVKAYCRPCEGLAASVTVAGETIVSTSRHPYFVTRGDDLENRPRLGHLAQVPDDATTPGRWVDAADLRVGDELLLLDGRIAQIEGHRVYPFFETVYNFEVDDLHCYAVGQVGVLVHNNNGAELNTFPSNPNDLPKQMGLPDLPPSKVGTTPDGTPRTVWEPNPNTRIRAESHPEGLNPGDPGFNPRHHGEHYHIETKPDGMSWGQAKRNGQIRKSLPPGYTPGNGTGFLPGEPFPGT